MIDVRTIKLVAGREIREQVRGRALWISTAITVLAVALLVVLPHLFDKGPPTYRVAVAGPQSAAFTPAIEAAVRSTGAKVAVVRVADRTAATAALRAKGDKHADLAVDLSGPGGVIVDREFPAGSTERKALVARAVSRTVATAMAVAASGLPAAQARALTDPTPLPIDHLRAAPSSASKRVVGIAGALLFYLLVLRYGFGLLMGVVQEKSTRVVEVILSTVRPVDLLVGKVLGAAVIVFTQGALLVATALISAKLVGSNVLKGSGAADIVVAGVWIVVGFLLYAAMFTAAGALASKSEDAQSVGLPLQIPLLVGYFTAFTSIGSGEAGTLVKVLAYIPFTAPMDMPVLSATGGAGTLQVVISMAITVLSTGVVLWLASVIFRRSILRTGQRVKLRQLLREWRHSATAPA